MKVLAIDVGGTSIKSALSENGKLVQEMENPSEAKSGAVRLLENIYKVIDMYEGYEKIGVSTTGQVDSGKGVIVFANENVPGYTGTPLKKLISEKFACPVVIENDVNAAAVGEGYCGAAKEQKDFLCLTYGTGVGGAIVLNKRVYKGASGVAGEFGHIITHAGGRLCACGQQGCYEQYASTTALIRRAQQVNAEWTNGRQLFKSMGAGDSSAKQVVDSWITEILSGLTGLVHIFNPPCIVLGGGIMNEAYVIEQIREQFPNRIMSSYAVAEIKGAELGNNAGLYGMVALAEQAGQ